MLFGKGLFKKRSYHLIVGAEVVAIAVGSALISSQTHNQGLVEAWIALVVGAHFIALARFSVVPLFYRVGAAMVAIAAIAWIGYLVGNWSESTVRLVAALPSAIVLYLSSWNGLATARARA